MEKQKNNKVGVVSRMQAYLDNFSKDNKVNKKDRKDYKKTHVKLKIECVSKFVFDKLLKSRGYGDMSFKGTPDVGNRVTEVYENSLDKNKNSKEDFER